MVVEDSEGYVIGSSEVPTLAAVSFASLFFHRRATSNGMGRHPQDRAAIARSMRVRSLLYAPVGAHTLQRVSQHALHR